MYSPPASILQKYAEVLINFALNGGQGIKRGETVFLHVPESAKPLLLALYEVVLRSKAHAIIQYMPDEMEKQFYTQADDDQLRFFPVKFLKGKIDQADHFLYVLAETNKHELEGIDPKRIIQRQQIFKKYRRWQEKKELAHRLTWTLGLYPTLAMAREAGITLTQAWEEVINACYLDKPNPTEVWRQIQSKNLSIRQKLDRLQIQKIRITSVNTNLSVAVGQNRHWLGCDGRNLPSFEIFTSPDWRGTEGCVYFNQPLYRYGHLIKDIRLEFKGGRVVGATASCGQSLLREMIKAKNANKIGEVSFTDKNLSRISRFMAETLYDENIGGRYGNFHLALGASFKEAYLGANHPLSDREFRDLGFNASAIHTDLISTEKFTAHAVDTRGNSVLIFKDGNFVL